MRIALVVPGGVSRDGERHVIPAILALVERLAALHDVQVVVPRQEREPGSWPLRGATVRNVGGAGRAWEARAVRLLIDLHRERAFDVFHAMWARGPGPVAVAAARICKRPAVVHVAGGELVWLPDVPFGDGRSWRRAVSRWAIRHADRVTAASAPMVELIASAAGADAIRVPLGADRKLWTTHALRPRGADRAARIVSVGSLTPVKDHATLLRAAAELVRRGREAHVDLVGEDTSGGAVTALIRELGMEGLVTLHGFLPQRAAREVVASADLMVVSSRHEAGPVAMLEAAALGVPTVGTPVGHVVEWAPHAASAVPFADPGALSDALGALLDDEPRRLGLARSARERAVAEDADWTADRFLEIYRDVIEERNGG